jgi:ribonucleoside-diphosphate reductase alpha chain
LLKNKGFNDQEINFVFENVLERNGSVQHLDILTPHEKEVFKSAMEIDQMASIRLASMRQKFIDQSQSVNLFFSPTVNVDYLHLVHFNAWLLGLKTLYYCRSERMIKANFFNQCTSCEG